MTRLTRNLVLSSPTMKGDDVKIVQGLLHVSPDGEFGPVTAGAAKVWKYHIGMKPSQVVPNLTTGEYPYLTGEKQQGPLMRLTAAARARASKESENIPSRAVDRMVKWSELLVKEDPSGSNRVPRLSDLALSTGLSKWYQAMGWPWCAFSAFLAARAEGLRVGPQVAGFGGKFNILYCPDVLARARMGQFSLRVVARGDARKGDLVLYDWDKDGVADHVERFITLTPTGFRSVGGNTSYDDAGSQSNGGAVAVRNRSWGNVIAIVREDY